MALTRYITTLTLRNLAGSDNPPQYYRERDNAIAQAERMAGATLVWYPLDNSANSGIIAADPEIRHLAYVVKTHKLEDAR